MTQKSKSVSIRIIPVVKTTATVYASAIVVASPAAIAAIDHMTLARELWSALDDSDARRFFPALRDRCHRVCTTVYPPASGELTLILVEE